MQMENNTAADTKARAVDRTGGGLSKLNAVPILSS